MKTVGMKNIYSRSIAVMLAIICLLITPVKAQAEAASGQSERKTVKVAFPSQSGMSGVDSSGNLSGYNYDYLQELSEYAGWDIEYITFDDMSANDSIMKAMEMVSSGEADLLGPMLYSESVEEMFDFPKDNYGVVYTTLCALEKSEITSVNFSKLSPLRVAVYKTATTRNDEVRNYLEQLGIEYKLIECETSDEQLKMLQDGKADVLSSITLSYFDGTRSVAEFAPRPYYFVTTKGNTNLIKELDNAVEALNYTSPYLQQKLQNKYFGNMSSGYVLSDDEAVHMNELKQLNVLCVNNDAPYVVKTDDNEQRGMLVSLLNNFAELNQIKINYTFCDDPTQTENEWNTGKYDCLIGIPFSSEYCSKNGLIRSEAVTTVDLVLYANQQTTKPLSESTLAVYDRLAEQVNLKNYGKVLKFDNPSDCFEAVQNGDADYGCSDRLIAEYNLYEKGQGLVTIPLLGEQEDICIAVSKDMGKEFLSALNKYIHTLPDNTKTTYLSDGSRHETLNWFTLFFRTNPVLASLLMTFVTVLIVCSVMFAFYTRKIRKKNYALEDANILNEEHLVALEQNRIALNDALVNAENASHAKGDFMSRMSHEIRTPLNAIIGYLDIAKDEQDNPQKVDHCIEKSQLASRHLLSIINDVLDISSIESGRMKLAKEDFDIKQMIQALTTLFYTQANNKGVNFEVHVEGISSEVICGDELRVRQILLNLLSNAIKFTSVGGSIFLNLREIPDAEKNTTRIQFQVQDTGIGMSKEYMNRMFQPFEQESASTARNYGGTGLGLSISNNLAHMMGGQITVDSELGKGTTFTVLLPFEVSKTQTLEVPNTDSFTNIYALVVDDEEDTCEYVATLMKRFGVKCDTVTSGKKALRRVTSRLETAHPYDLCIIDWCMNGMDGLETARNVRSICGNNIPIIIATGYDYSAIVDEAKEAGVNKIISKPLFQSTMLNLLINTYGKYKPTESKKKKQVNFHGMKAILAEDNEMNMEIALDMLSKAGLEITPVVNGKEAVDVFTSSAPNTFDAILMDVQMPVLDGYEATKTIRNSSHPQAKSTPIIAMTANAFTEDVTAALAAGMNDHVAKPISYDRLYDSLSRLTKSETE